MEVAEDSLIRESKDCLLDRLLDRLNAPPQLRKDPDLSFSFCPPVSVPLVPMRRTSTLACCPNAVPGTAGGREVVLYFLARVALVMGPLAVL